MIAEFPPLSPPVYPRQTWQLKPPSLTAAVLALIKQENEKKKTDSTRIFRRCGCHSAAQVAKKLKSLYRVAFAIPSIGITRLYRYLVDTCPHLGFGEMVVGFFVFHHSRQVREEISFVNFLSHYLIWKNFRAFSECEPSSADKRCGNTGEQSVSLFTVYRKPQKRDRDFPALCFPRLNLEGGKKIEWKFNESNEKEGRRGGKQPHSRFLFWYRRAWCRGAVQVI